MDIDKVKLKKDIENAIELAEYTEYSFNGEDEVGSGAIDKYQLAESIFKIVEALIKAI